MLIRAVGEAACVKNLPHQGTGNPQDRVLLAKRHIL